MTDLVRHLSMLGDGARLRAYRSALRHRIRPGDDVLDVGAGSGVLSLFAAQAGARRVYAVEREPVAGLIERLARENGCADRIQVLRCDARELELPGRVRVLVSDVRGVLPLAGDGLALLAALADRFLEIGGALIPLRDEISLAPWGRRSRSVHSPTAAEAMGLRIAALREAITGEPVRVSARPAELIAPAATWSAITYPATVERVSGEVAWRIERAATADGLLAWFRSELAPGIDFDSSPGREDNCYGQLLLPWPEPIGLGPGDEIVAQVRADPVGGDWVWTWETEVRGRHAVRFHQSSLPLPYPRP
jgi:SAM-dependent methyltransferase